MHSHPPISVASRFVLWRGCATSGWRLMTATVGRLPLAFATHPPDVGRARGYAMQERVKQSARVFIARSGERAVVVTMHVNEYGILFEDDSARILEAPLSPDAIGTAVRAAMMGTARRSRDLRQARMSDWPAFRASGLRTVKSFEAEFIAIDVDAANDANLVAVITGSPEKDAELEVTSSVSTACPEKIGEYVLRVYEACRDRRV